MATVTRFEDLLCWQRARELVRLVYLNFKSLNDYGFKDQIQRAAVSVLSNISEGFESGTREEFVNYLYIAKASAGEVRAQLYVALDVNYVERSTFNRLTDTAEAVSAMLYKFIESVKSSKYKGSKFKKTPDPKAEAFKRFLADVALEGGAMVTAHCANPGSMLSVNAHGSEVWLSESPKPSRKLRYTWELIRVGQTLVGINTAHPNRLVEEAIRQDRIFLAGHQPIGEAVEVGL